MAISMSSLIWFPMQEVRILCGKLFWMKQTLLRVRFICRRTCKVTAVKVLCYPTASFNTVGWNSDIVNKLWVAKFLQRIQHSNIFSILSILVDGLSPDGKGHAAFIQMEFCQRDLENYIVDQVLKWRRIFSFLEYTSLLLDVVRGIDFMHENGLIHRDIKPQNSTPRFGSIYWFSSITPSFWAHLYILCDFGF